MNMANKVVIAELVAIILIELKSLVSTFEKIIIRFEMSSTTTRPEKRGFPIKP